MRMIKTLIGLGAMLVGSTAIAQPLPLPFPLAPLAPLAMAMSAPAGAKVAFTACPIWVDVYAGCMIAVDPTTGVHFSLVGATPPSNYVAVITGTTSARGQVCPGVPLDGIKAVATKIACRSGGLPNKK